MMSRASPFAANLARVRIVSINDVYELANLPRLQTFLKELSPKPSAVVLAGDFLSPSPLSSIDGGRGMVSSLRSIGITHVSIGNHEQDLQLDSLRERLEELSSPTGSKILSNATVVLNSNMRRDLPPKAEWMKSVTQRYSVIESPCGKIKLALLGLLSDEPGLFRDGFKSVPIQNVLETYTEIYNELVTVPRQRNDNSDHQQQQPTERPVDFLLPLTHESIVRDKELARHILTLHRGGPVSPGLIIGGHEHDPYHEIVTPIQQIEEGVDTDCVTFDREAIHILKSGMDARNACLVDLIFDIEDGKSRLVEVQAELINMFDYEPSPFAQKIVDKHMSVVQALEDEIIIDAGYIISLPPDEPLSSERSRYQQTTMGSVFCQMIKEEIEDCDVAMVNGATIKGDMVYENPKMSYAELKSELPFPTKIVCVDMTQHEIYEAIHYSRTAIEGGVDYGAEEAPRRGYLQVDNDWDQRMRQKSEDDKNDENVRLKVALPRNLLNGFCKIKPLMNVGKRLKQEGRFPGDDDFIPAIDLIVRHACKNRWLHIVRGKKNFQHFDLNHDGVLDKHEIKIMMEEALGYEPADFVVDDMISCIDLDDNGVIDHNEFNILLTQMERENECLWRK